MSNHLYQNPAAVDAGPTKPRKRTKLSLSDLSQLHPDGNMSEADVCRFLALSRSTVRNKLDEDGPYFDPSFPKPSSMRPGAKKGSKVLFRVRDVMNWNRAQHGLPPLQETLSREGGD